MSAESPTADAASSGDGPDDARTAASAAIPAVTVAEPVGVPRPKRRTSTRNLLLAFGVTMAFVAVLVLLVPRPNSVARPSIDLAAAASAAAPQLSFAPAVAVPAGWTVTSADVRTDSGDLATWTVNYLTDQQEYVGLMQAGGWNARWQSSLTHGGTPVGDVDVDGVLWNRFEKPERQITSLLRRGQGVTTLVLAKGGGVADAEVLAKSLSSTP